MIGAVENTTAPETAKLCAQYLGPALRLRQLQQHPALPINAYLRPAINPDRIIYTDPKLAPGGAGPGDAPEPPPTVSAYTGAGRHAAASGLERAAEHVAGHLRASARQRRAFQPVAAVINHAPPPGAAAHHLQRARRRRRPSTGCWPSGKPGAASPTRNAPAVARGRDAAIMIRRMKRSGRRRVVRCADVDGLLVPGVQLTAAARGRGTGTRRRHLPRRGRRMSRRWSRIRRC